MIALLGLLTASLEAGDPARSPKVPKGVELYSWQADDGAWLFALLPGTNRVKPERLVKEVGPVIKGVPALKDRLRELAEQEQVFWFHRDAPGFVHPPEDAQNEIISFSRENAIFVHLPEQNERQTPAHP